MGFKAETYRLDTQIELFDIMDAAVSAVTEGKPGIVVTVEDDKVAKALVLRLHKFRLAFEAQTDDPSLKYNYAGLKIAPCLVSAGADKSGVSVAVANSNAWKITVLE